MDLSRRTLFTMLILIAVISAVLTMGCSKAVGFAEYDAMEEAPAPAMAERSKAMASESEADFLLSADEAPMGSSGSEAITDETEHSESARKRIYNGSAGLVVDRTEEVRINLEDLAVDSGGYIESSFIDYVILRIPAEKFQDVFDQVLLLGRVEYSRIDTVDVTEAYADIARRLDTALKTRQRLYILLERSTDPAERARILREIGRLTEEIESLKQQTAIMDSRISFSTISVQLIPRITQAPSKADIPFPWIAALDPMVPAGYKLKADLDIDLGEDWAVFSKQDVFVAEDGERNHFFASTINNDPRGDSEFWQAALSHHLAPYYRELEEKSLSIGSIKVQGVELISKDRQPFRYFVGIVPDGRRLHIIEFFSPDSSDDFDEIISALAAGGLR